MNGTIGIDLTQFVEKGHQVPNWSHPFVLNGWRYATDGRIAVRVPAPGEPDEPVPANRVETIASAFTPPMVQPQAWPDTPPVRSVFECRECDGHGRIGREKCKECGGTGEVECPHCGSETDCEECDGGYVSAGGLCPTCGGKRRIEQDNYQRVGAFAVRGDYAEKIRALPGLLWCGNNEKQNSIHFRFDGGEGVVMKLNVPND